MKFRIHILLVVIFAMFSSAYGQELSKDEKKSLKKEIKALLKDPAKYKVQKETLAEKEATIQDQTTELMIIGDENSKNKNRLELAQDSIDIFSTRIIEVEKELNMYKTPGSQNNTGMKFRLQIGKYKEFDITNFLEETKLFTFEKDEDGVFIYTIGNFDTEEDAELFKSAMRKIGVTDAFVAFYLDGVRIAKD